MMRWSDRLWLSLENSTMPVILRGFSPEGSRAYGRTPVLRKLRMSPSGLKIQAEL